MKELSHQELYEISGGNVFMISLACVAWGTYLYHLLKTTPSLFRRFH